MEWPVCKLQVWNFVLINNKYRKVASSSMSRLVAHFQTFRRLMKRKFDAYVLWPLAKKFQNWIVDGSTARDFTVYFSIFSLKYSSLLGNERNHFKIHQLKKFSIDLWNYPCQQFLNFFFSWFFLVWIFQNFRNEVF